MSRLGERHEGVPKFGGWDHKSGETNYSMVFSQARAKKKRTRNEGPHFRPNPENEFMSHQALAPPPALYAPPSLAYPFQAPHPPKAFQSRQHEKPKTGFKQFLKKLIRCMRR